MKETQQNGKISQKKAENLAFIIVQKSWKQSCICVE